LHVRQRQGCKLKSPLAATLAVPYRRFSPPWPECESCPRRRRPRAVIAAALVLSVFAGGTAG
jgi:hypothetical protein